MTEEFKLQPVDILVNVNDCNDPWSRIERWGIGPYSHVFVFLGRIGVFVDGIILKVPMLFESNGRGVCLRLLSERYGEKVVVMRLKSEFDQRRIYYVLEEAVKLASDERARYDYWCIVSFIIPRILARKLHLPLPSKYDRDPFMVCSEAALEIFLRAKIDILPKDIVPLPGDFVTDSPLLKAVETGILNEDWIKDEICRTG